MSSTTRLEVPFAIRLAAVWLSLFAASNPPADARDLWIKNIAIVSPERTQPLAGATVKIHDERIVEISRRASPPKREAADVIDGKGLFLVPGLIDSHVHLYYIPGMLPEQEQAHPDIAQAARKQFSKSYLYFRLYHLGGSHLDTRGDRRVERAHDPPRHVFLRRRSRHGRVSDEFHAEADTVSIDAIFSGRVRV